MVSKYTLAMLMLLAACRNHSTRNISPAVAALEKKNVQLIDAEQFRKHWKDYVSLKMTKCERVMFGGFKRVEFTLFNDSPYMIDSVSVRVNFIEDNKKIYKYGYATAVDIEQGEEIILDAPFSLRGDSLNYSIDYLKVREAKLDFKNKKLYKNL